jgi:thiol-disulfide isomerase/thioredoxin
MKKFFPALFIVTVFTLMMIAQMVINGKDLAASKTQKAKEKFAAYETEFQKLTLKTFNGKTYKLAEHKDKVVILNFWASWCQPCLSEFSTLKKLVKKFPEDKLLVIGINNDEEDPTKAVKKVVKDLNLNFENVIDQNNSITSKFFISAIPASIAFHNGKVIHYVNKEFDFMKDSFVDKVEDAVKEE